MEGSVEHPPKHFMVQCKVDSLLVIGGNIIEEAFDLGRGRLGRGKERLATSHEWAGRH
jgi:hypothetical protein